MNGATVLTSLPADGSPIVADLAVERSGLAPGAAWPALAALCASGQAKAWRHEGVTWAKRIDVQKRERPAVAREALRRTEPMRQGSSAAVRVNPSGVA